MIGALHRTLHAIALAEAESVLQIQFDASPIDGQEWVTAPTQLCTKSGGTETWFGGAVRSADANRRRVTRSRLGGTRPDVHGDDTIAA